VTLGKSYAKEGVLPTHLRIARRASAANGHTGVPLTHPRCSSALGCTQGKFGGRVSQKPVAVASPILFHDVIGSDALPADGKGGVRGAK
jgi:hypothetical protein